MKLITKDTDYAIRALLYLAQRGGELRSSQTIARKNRIPLPFLRRVLQTLIKHRIIISKEGVDGGVKLRSKPDSICLSDLIKIFQGNIQLSECMFRKDLCPNRSRCVLRRRIKGIEQKVIKEFKSLSIATLLDDLKSQ